MTNEDLLYRYFSNSLNEDELIVFNKRLESDAKFKADFEFENNLKQAIKKENSNKLKEKLKTFEADIPATETFKKKSKFNWRIAASIVFFLGASWFGYNSFFGVNYNSLYDANFSNYPNTEFPITRSDTIDSFERKAFVAYEAGDFDNAISNFKIIPIEEQKPYQAFYKAQAYLEIGNLKEAKNIFNNIINKNSTFVAESHWYLALIAIKEKNKIEATNQLRVLTENFNYNKSKAEALLKELH